MWRAAPYLLILSVLACASQGTSAVSEDVVGMDSPVERAELRFADAADGRTFDAARACFAARGAKWSHFRLRKIGNFIEEDWCTGPGSERGCSGGSFRDRPGARWESVGTLHYDRDWPQVFGLTLSAGHVAPGQDWSVSASVASGGQSILGEGTHVAFRRGVDERTAVYLGSVYSRQIDRETISVRPEGSSWQVLDRLRRSPTSMRDEGIAMTEALQAEVVRKLDAGEILTCVYGEYHNDGIPPACLEEVPLAADAVAREKAALAEETARIIATLQSHHVQLHAALLEVFGPDCVPSVAT